MLRGLGLLLPVLVFGGLLHSKVMLSGGCTSFHMSKVLSGDKISAAERLQSLCFNLMFPSEYPSNSSSSCS